MDLDNLGGRKLIMSVFVVVISTILLIGSYISNDQFTQIVKAIVLFYIGGNVVQKYIQKESYRNEIG